MIPAAVRAPPKSPPSWLAPASFAALVLVLWLPFDPHRTALMEWWASNAGYDQHGFNIPLSGPHKTRPLGSLPTFLGHSLSPDSFVGANLLLALLIFARMAVPYAAGRLIERRRPALAYVYALLFALYPADSMMFALRGLGTHFTVVCYLLAAWLLVLYWRRPGGGVLAGMWLLLAIGLFSAPTPMGAVLVTPLALFRMERRISWRLVRVSLLWWAVPALVCLYTVLSSMFLSGENYLDRIWIWHGGLSLYKVKTLALSVALVYTRHFATAWSTAATDLFARPTFTVLAVVAAAGLSATAWRLLAAHPRPRPADLAAPDARRWITVGAVMTFVGFLPFWPTSYRLDDWRVYYVSPLGAALVLVVLSTWLDRRFRAEGRLFLTISGVLIALSLISAFHQTAYYQEKSFFEQRLLADIVAQAPLVTDEAAIVIVDAALEPAAELPGGFAEGHFFYPHGFVDALGFLYEDYRHLQAVAICSPTARAACTFDADGVTISGRISVPRQPGIVRNRAVPYHQLVVFSYSESERLNLVTALPWPSVGYDPYRLIAADAEMPRRAFTLLSRSIRPVEGAGDADR